MAHAAGSTHNALSSRFAAWRGLLLNSFTWSKAIGNSEQALETFAGGSASTPQDIRNLRRDRGVTTFDVTFINTTSLVYDMPFGRGRKIGSNMNRVLDTIIGGWQTNSIISFKSGTALDVQYSPSTANDNSGLSSDWRGATTLRPNVSGAHRADESTDG